MLSNTLIQNLFKNATILFSGNVVASFISLASFTLTARALGVEQFGILVLITTYVLIVDGIVNFQSWQAIIKYGAEALQNKHNEDFKSLLKFGFLLDVSTAFIGTGIAISAAKFIWGWWGWDDQYILMACFYSLTILFHINGTPIAILRLFDNFKEIATQQFIAELIKFIGVVIAFKNGSGLVGFLFVWFFVDIIGKGILVYYALRQLKKQNILNVAKSKLGGVSRRFKGIWVFVLTTNLNSSIRMSTRELDVMFIASVLGTGSVGLYKTAKQFSSIIQKLVEPLYQVIYPDLAKLYSQGKVKQFINLGVNSLTIAGVFSVIIWFVFYFNSEYIIALTVGKPYLQAIPVMLWYMSAIVVATFSFPLQPAMLSMGRPHMAFWIHIGSSVVYLVILSPLLSNHGLVGAGIAYLIYYIIWGLLMLIIESIILRKKVA